MHKSPQDQEFKVIPTIQVTQAEIQSFELAYPKIYLIYSILECVKGLVLMIQSFGISRTQGSNRMIERSPCEEPGLM
jgi:E3 ubiquitin-protein ligase DOA10